MAKAVSPVLPGYEVAEHVYGSGQERFGEMPGVRLNEDGDFLFRYRLSDEERRRVCETGEVFAVVHTRSRDRSKVRMMPVSVFAEPPPVEDGDVVWPDEY